MAFQQLLPFDEKEDAPPRLIDELACAEVLTETSYFGRLLDRPGLHRSLQNAFDELRAAGLTSDTLPEIAFADRRKHRELRDVLRSYERALEMGRFMDGLEVLRRALKAVESSPPVEAATTYLLPGVTELSSQERAFLEKLAAGRPVTLPADPLDGWKSIAREARLFRAIGEENEIRELFRSILRDGISFDDVEILYSDRSVYPSLFWELSREHDVPCTFASGIAISYTRPGQAALAFLDWIAEGFASDAPRRALASGALTFSRLDGSDPESPGTRTAARALRDAGIGWGRERHLSCLDRLIGELEKPEERWHADADLTDDQQARREERRARHLLAARRARDFVRRAVALAPASVDGWYDLRSLAAGARTFVAEFGHVGDELDGTARTALDALLKEFTELLPLQLPVSAALGRDRPSEAAAALWACLGRLRGKLTASYPSFDLRNLSQAGEPAASPAFLNLYRERSSRAEADYADLAKALPRAAGFVPSEEAALDDTEWWFSRLREADATGRDARLAPAVRAAYPWLEDGHRADEARSSGKFTVWDGWIQSGTPELDPRRGGEPFSPSRLQDLAKCPFAYFVRHVLHVDAPKDLERDPTRWLDPMSEGSLLHELFRDFFQRITEAGEKPETARHLRLILELAEERILAWKDRVPPKSELAFALQCDNIRFACRTLLALEEEHCRDITPRYFEVPFGLPRQAARTRALVASPDPVAIEVGSRGSFLLRGSIDRVDEAADGTFHVWDYKTGSAWSIREGTGLRGGRQIQPVLYAMAFETLLDRAGRPGSVSKSGYFFPGRKGEGQRMLAPLDRGQTREVLRRLFDLLAAGMFPHALSPEDCKFCVFEAICGGAKAASARAREKLAGDEHAVLTEFRKLHAEEADCSAAA